MKATLFVPGRGEVRLGERAQLKECERIIREEDPEDKLILGQNAQTQEWVLFLKPQAHPFGLDRPYPVLSLGTDTPQPERLRELLYKADTRRNGDQILKDIHANNERIRSVSRAAADEGTGLLAEARASYLHSQGKAPYHQSLPKRDPVHTQYSTRKD